MAALVLTGLGGRYDFYPIKRLKDIFCQNIVIAFQNLFKPQASIIGFYTNFRFPLTSVEQNCTEINNFNIHRVKKILVQKYFFLSQYLFIAILSAKILCLTWALGLVHTRHF